MENWPGVSNLQSSLILQLTSARGEGDRDLPRSAELSSGISGLESESGFGSSNFLGEPRARDRDFRIERPDQRRGSSQRRTEKGVPAVHLVPEPGRRRRQTESSALGGAFFGIFESRIGERVRKFGFSAGSSSSGSRSSSRATRSTARKLAGSSGKTESRAGKRRSRAERGGRREPRATKTTANSKARTCREYLRGDGCKGVN